jgi:hypothetical protein
MHSDSGPSLPASPLIQDDGLLRRDFARRGFSAARQVCTRARSWPHAKPQPGAAAMTWDDISESYANLGWG